MACGLLRRARGPARDVPRAPQLQPVSRSPPLKEILSFDGPRLACLSIHFGHLGSFCLQNIPRDAAWTEVGTRPFRSPLSAFGETPTSGVAGSRGCSTLDSSRRRRRSPRGCRARGLQRLHIHFLSFSFVYYFCSVFHSKCVSQNVDLSYYLFCTVFFHTEIFILIQ